MTCFRGWRTGSAGTGLAEQQASCVAALTVCGGGGGATAVSHSGTSRAREWEAKPIAVGPGPSNHDTEGTSAFPQRGRARGARLWRGTLRVPRRGLGLYLVNVLMF